MDNCERSLVYRYMYNIPINSLFYVCLQWKIQHSGSVYLKSNITLHFICVVRTYLYQFACSLILYISYNTFSSAIIYSMATHWSHILIHDHCSYSYWYKRFDRLIFKELFLRNYKQVATINNWMQLMIFNLTDEELRLCMACVTTNY